MTRQTTNPTRENCVRARFPGPGLKRSASDGPTVMFGELAVFDQWTEINSRVEGHFMECVAAGAFKKTFAENIDRIRVLLNHGLDPSTGLKPLGPIISLREDADAARYEVELLDADYVREILPGLEAGLYGSSFRMRPTKIERVSRPRPSAHNPNGLPEQTIRETGVVEFGPVTFAQYPGATAGVRSLTDDFVREMLADDEGRLWQPGSSISVPADLKGGKESSARDAELPEQTRAELIEDGLYARCTDMVADEPWLITPAAYATIKAILAERRAGGKPTADEISARVDGLSRQAPDSPQGTVAVIPFYGPIVPKATYFTQVSGVTSVEGFQEKFRAALESNDVTAIVIDINSPGGRAAMIPELAAEILAAREVKPIIGVANTMAGSAAYWVMACCTEAVATPSGSVGSIGACADHTDLTAAMEAAGVKVTQFSSAVSPYKLELSPLRPLSKEAVAHAQGEIDRLGEQFVAVVAEGRGVPVATVLEQFGQGRMLNADDALDAGMIDKIATLEQTVASLGNDAEELPSDESDEADAPLPDEDGEDGDGDAAANADERTPGAATGHSATGAELAHSADRSRSSEPAAAAAIAPKTEMEGSSEMLHANASLAEKKARLVEIDQRLKEMQVEHAAGRMADAAQTEWDGLIEERAGLEADVADVEGRLEQLRSIGIEETGAAKSQRQIRVNGREGGFTPGVTRVEDPFDFSTLRANSLNPDELGSELRDRAMRVIETARFRQPNVSIEDAQTSAARLLEDVDTADGALARHMLVTGSDVYRRAFGKSLGNVGLTREEQTALDLARAASLTDAQGGFAVPFTLDPTVILTSDGAVNPIRAISRVAQTVTDNWHGVTSAGVVAAYRSGEGVEASDGAPTLQQPAVPVEEADVFIPYSYAVGQDWVGMGSEFAMMIADAKDVLEADKYLHGRGSGFKEPEGLIAGLENTSIVESDAAHAFTYPDVYAVEDALPPRFRSKAQWIANRAIYNLIRQFDTQGGAQLWMRINQLLENTPSGNTGAQVLGYAANEASEMDDAIADGADILVLGDFRHFVVVDRIGMSVEAIPNLFGPNGRPTGQRGLYAYWRNSSAVLVDNAFRKLRVSAT